MPRLIVACMARNEASRFFMSALQAWQTFADEIVVLDDGSTDGTGRLARDAGATVARVDGSGSWGQESPTRQLLWELACSRGLPGEDWVFVLDADMTPARDPRPLLALPCDAVAFYLYDLWSQDASGALRYRDDGLWRGHTHPRLWLVRIPEEPAEGWAWSERGIHPGHLPGNLQPERTIIAPRDHSLLHYAYLTEELREAKQASYLAEADQLSPSERAHAESITSSRPALRPLPFSPRLTLSLPALCESSQLP